MNLAIACDHRGYDAKRKLLPWLVKAGHTVHDMGCDSTTAVDYPDIAAPLSRHVAAGKYEIGILLDGSGIGMSVVANKIKGVRAALAHDEVTARIAREHNHCNVVCLGVDLLSEDHVKKIVETFLAATLVEGRHRRRIEKIAKIEAEERK
jgi:ribose 5-phosphate isomerase B